MHIWTLILDIAFKSEMGSKIRKIDIRIRESNVKLRLCCANADKIGL